MKVCVYGCGAIGSLLAARMAAVAEVSVIARGAHLDAIRTNGLQLLPGAGGDPQTVRLNASDDPAEMGEQDVVFLAMKSHSVPAVAAAIAPLLGADTRVVTASNGIPWWYFYGLPADFGAPELHSVDPDRKLWHHVGPERALGIVVYPAAAIIRPGVVQHVFGDRFTIGEPAAGDSARLHDLAGLMQRAGFDVSMSAHIRAELWTKLVANAAFNPVSVMTGKTLGAMIDDPATHALLLQIMAEVRAVASALGVQLTMEPEQLLVATRQLGEHKTSMLQDLEAGRPLEMAPIVGAVLELAELFSVAAGNLDMVHRLASARSARL